MFGLDLDSFWLVCEFCFGCFVIVFGGCCLCMVVVCLASLFRVVVWLV